MFECVQICSVSDTLRKPSSPAAVLIYPVQRVQRPGVCGMVCPGTCPALVLARPALLPVLCSPPGCAGGGRGTLAGYTWSAGGGVVSVAIADQNKKGDFPTYPPLSCVKHPYPHCRFQKSRQKTKRPLQRVCVLCYTCLTSLEREESVK